MTTITIKINERTKTGKAFMALLSEAFTKGDDGVEIVETDSKKLKKEKSIYSPEFIAKIKKAEKNIKNGETTTLNPDDIWGSLGLK
ncbi:DUF2683 family protein [Flavobacterium piscis]|uniref:Prevent-host-death protein n=1 Tax=Flavobacterium piscis TaxID=1114874 RepID=A0ABU1Y496_9FLAO|nr:DUF2683 family protein [Flavobacterium piscis]MDR7208878.1 hypothetical protein [Flavobacterium piscis]